MANGKLKNSDTLDVSIEKLVYGGEGLARSNGQVVLVPFVLPGERVTVTPERVKSGLMRSGRPVVVESSPERVIPRCEYFFTCGGCQYQHADYAIQVQQKIGILRETLLRLGGISYDGEINVVAGDPWYYRNRIQLHFEDGRSGFHRAGSRDLCAIDHCYISSPTLVEVVKRLDQAASEPEWPRFLRSLEVFTNEQEIQLNVLDTTRPIAARFFEWGRTFLPPMANGPIEYRAAGRKFQISRGSFFQVNRFLIDALVKEVLGERSGKYAIDLYAGVGLFSLALAQRFERTAAVERGGSGYRDLEVNAARAATNLAAAKLSAEEFLRGVTEKPDLIVADPPRAGLDRDATAGLLGVRASSVVLVSCDPSTMSRDLKKLLTLYDIERLTMLDLFPQTYHFETVVHLRLRQ